MQRDATGELETVKYGQCIRMQGFWVKAARTYRGRGTRIERCRVAKGITLWGDLERSKKLVEVKRRRESPVRWLSFSQRPSTPTQRRSTTENLDMPGLPRQSHRSTQRLAHHRDL